MLNGNTQPKIGKTTAADSQADKIISGLTSYNRDSNYMYNLRRLIGLKNGGEVSQIPEIKPKAEHERANEAPSNYYINFQDPTNAPTANPLVVNGKTYTKIGWEAYDKDKGYGWYGNMDHVMYKYLSSGPNELQKSVIYDDWGRQHTFEYNLPNGKYNVTISAGWEGRSYDHNRVNIEGVDFIDDEATNPYIVRTKQVEIKDQKLTMEMSIFDEYTMLNYLDIEAVGGAVVSDDNGNTEVEELESESSETTDSKTHLTDIGGHKNQTAIEYLVEKGVINGYPDKTFKPNNDVNRAELLKILIEGKGVTPDAEKYKNCFPDVKTQWFAKYICYAKDQKWIKGYEDGTYRPGRTVNKVESIKILLNSQDVKVSDVGVPSVFNDVKTTDWFSPYVEKAHSLGILEETGGYFSPGIGMKRSGVSENLYRLIK